MRNRPSSAAVLATVAVLSTFAANSVEGKERSPKANGTEAFDTCNDERKGVNSLISPVRMMVIAAAYPQYFTLYTVQQGDTWDGLYRRFHGKTTAQGVSRDIISDANQKVDDRGAAALPDLVPGMQVILPSERAAKDEGTNAAASAIIENYMSSTRAPDCNEEWNGNAAYLIDFDSAVANCVKGSETKGGDLAQCIGSQQLDDVSHDPDVSSCEESLGSAAKCRQTVRDDCQRAMKMCDTRLTQDIDALTYIRVAHNKLAAQRLKEHGGKR